MKYIEKLTLENFEGWVKGEIPFTKGFNVIIGDSDSGKSSLFRAIESIFTGKVGQENVNRNAKNLKVTLKLSDGTTFTREYGKKGNKISFGNTVFERIGREVPSEYTDKLGKSYVDISDKNRVDLCLYSQFDPHFFINFSDYDKSKLIGTICGIGSIDKLIDIINKDIRENNAKIKVLNEQITEKEPRVIELESDYKQEKEKFDEYAENLKDYEQNLNILEFLFNAYNELEQYKNKETEIKQKQDKINAIINSIKIADLSDFSKLADSYLAYNKINALIADLVAKIAQLKPIADYILPNTEELETINNLFGKIQEINEKILSIENKMKIKNDIMSIDTEIISDFELLAESKKKLDDFNKTLFGLSEKQVDLSIKIKTLEQSRKDLLKDIKSCPLCGGVINGK